MNKVLTALRLPTVKEKNKTVVKEKAKEYGTLRGTCHFRWKCQVLFLWKGCAMNVFDTVKQSVTTRQVAEMYGLKVRRKTDAQIYAEAEQQCFRVLSDYYHLLKKWETNYTPGMDDETWHPLFVEALRRKTHLEYLLDILVLGEIEEKALLVMGYGKEVASLEQRISEFTRREAETSIGSSQ